MPALTAAFAALLAFIGALLVKLADTVMTHWFKRIALAIAYIGTWVAATVILWDKFKSYLSTAAIGADFSGWVAIAAFLPRQLPEMITILIVSKVTITSYMVVMRMMRLKIGA